MKKKRIISLSILAALLLGQLAACGDTPPVSDDTDPQGSDTTEVVIPPEYVKPDVDYGGETFTIASFNFDFAYAVAKYTMISHEEESGDMLNDAIIKMTRQVEDELNIKFEMIEMGISDRFNVGIITKSIQAGDDEIQAAFPTINGFTKILTKPQLTTDLNDVPTLDLSHSWWNQNILEEYNIGGKQYTAIGDICFFSKAAPICFFFNKQLVDDNNLDDPYQMVYDGTWTYDKAAEMITTVANDVNGNQKVDDREDIFGMLCESSTLGDIVLGCGVRYIERDKDDNISLIFPVEKTSIIVEKLVPILRDKSLTLFANDYYGIMSNPDPFEGLLQPTFMENRGLFFCNQLLLALDFRAMETDFGILPIPKFDKEQKEYYSNPNGAWCDCLMIPSTNQDLERTGNIIEAMGYYSQQYVTPAFLDTTVLDKSVRDEHSEYMVRLVWDNQVHDIARLFGWGSITGIPSTLCSNNSTNVASEFATRETKFYADMEKTMNVLLGE